MARRAGSLTWAGLYNTYYWIDPASRIAGVIMMQILPFADRRALTFAVCSSAVFTVPISQLECCFFFKCPFSWRAFFVC